MSEESTRYLVKQIEQLLMTLDPLPQRIDVISASLLIAAMQISICTSDDNSIEEALYKATQFFHGHTYKFSEALLETRGLPN